MDNILQADIFFFISSVATIVITFILSIVGYYIILIVRDAKYITSKLRNATDEFEEKYETVKEHISEEGRKAKYLVDFFLSKFTGGKKSKSRSSKGRDTYSEEK